MKILQPSDLASAWFKNNGTAGSGGVTLNDDAGSAFVNFVNGLVAATPAANAIKSFASYNSATNVVTFNNADGTTTNANFADIISDAIGETVALATVTIEDNAGTVLFHAFP